MVGKSEMDLEFAEGLTVLDVWEKTSPDDLLPSDFDGDLIPDDSLPSSDEILSGDELKAEIGSAMHALTEGEARVLKMYYGLDGHEPMTLEEIGAYVGRTRERVRQIKEKALQKLRHPARSDSLKEYYSD